MHRQKKFLIWASIFLSISACGEGVREVAETGQAPTTTRPELIRVAAHDGPTTFNTTTTVAPTTTVPPAPPAIRQPPPVEVSSTVQPANIWDQLAQCESGGNWNLNTGNGYYGGLQFSLGSWQGVGGTGYPHEHSRDTQIEMGRRLQASQGWGAWGGCARRLGLT